MMANWTAQQIALWQHRAQQHFSWGVMIEDTYLLYPSMSLNRIATILNGWEVHRTDKPVLCYTDGSGTTSKKIAGIGVVVYEQGSSPVYIAECVGEGSNNYAELHGLWRALKQFPDRRQHIRIFSDSQYAAGSVTLDWSPNANIELIRNIREDLSLRPNVSIEHVDGHSGLDGNEIADRLANIGRKLVRTVSL